MLILKHDIAKIHSTILINQFIIAMYIFDSSENVNWGLLKLYAKQNRNEIVRCMYILNCAETYFCNYLMLSKLHFTNEWPTVMYGNRLPNS